MIIHRPPFIIHHFASLGSTNDQLKAMAAAPEFTCVVADEQTAGRGRRARAWYSTPGDGLYLSILFLPRSDSSSRLPLTGLLAAVAVAEVHRLEPFGEPLLLWHGQTAGAPGDVERVIMAFDHRLLDAVE